MGLTERSQIISIFELSDRLAVYRRSWAGVVVATPRNSGFVSKDGSIDWTLAPGCIQVEHSNTDVTVLLDFIQHLKT